MDFYKIKLESVWYSGGESRIELYDTSIMQENTAFDLDPSQATFRPWTLSGEKPSMGPSKIHQHISISSGLVLFKCLGN